MNSTYFGHINSETQNSNIVFFFFRLVHQHFSFFDDYQAAIPHSFEVRIYCFEERINFGTFINYFDYQRQFVVGLPEICPATKRILS